jgi:group I intron endonuclease
MEKKYCVYQHVNLINGKIYIGITKRTLEERSGANGINYHTSPYFYSAIQKYGWDNFQHNILYSELTKEDACALEIQLIKEMRTQDSKYGYNIMEGGSAPTIPDSVRKIMSEKMKGNKNGLGKACSEEKKQKIREAQKGRKLTEDHKRKLSEAKRGKTYAPLSEERKRKISNSHKKKQVYCEELKRVFSSIQECARELGLNATNICACCKGKHSSHHGYHFRYFEE